jgi:hypothetical protein
LVRELDPRILESLNGAVGLLSGCVHGVTEGKRILVTVSIGEWLIVFYLSGHVIDLPRVLDTLE